MNPILRNILAVLAGIFAGSIVNYGTIKFGAGFLPVPEGVDPTDFESIKANVDFYTSKDMILPILAHAVGSLTGAYAVSRLAASHYKTLALVIAGIFMIGGIMMAIGLPELRTLAIIDIIVAYVPAALLGWKLAGSPK